MRKYSFLLFLLLSSTGLLLYCSGPTEPELDNPYDQESGSYVPTPDLNTAPVTPLAQAAITGGEFTNDYGKPVTQKGVCWSTNENPDIEDSCTNDGEGIGTFESQIEGLEVETTYYTRAYATNADGTIYGGQRSFTTMDGVATITTVEASEITAFSAITGGDISDDGGAEISERGVCYSTTENPTLEDNCVTAGEGIGSYEATLEELSPVTQYYFRAFANNAVGTTYGNEESFVTNDRFPGLTTTPATAITAFSAESGGTINTDGEAQVTGRGVCYSTSESPTLEDSCVASGAGEGSFTVSLEELTPDTPYFARAYSESAAGVGYGNQIEFVTRDGIASITTTVPFDISRTSARTGGAITDNGGADITEAGVCYIQGDGTPDLNDTCIIGTLDSNTFEVLLEDLIQGETYTVRAYATTELATAWGDNSNFTTFDWPTDTETEVVNVTNPTTGRTWMDRNLGASRAATSSTDSEAYGDLYQWGRAADGHEKRNSSTTSTLSSIDQPGHGDFILAPDSPYDWRSPQNDNLWQGEDGINNPCPDGYRLPTEAEWDAERASWSSNNASGAFNSPLKLPKAGNRSHSSGSLINVGFRGYCWSASVSGSNARRLYFDSSNADVFSNFRAGGRSVRCLED